MFRFSTIGIAIAVALNTVPVVAQSIEGMATAIDGDTLEMTGARIRLLHVDAPESKQTCTRAGEPWACGEEAKDLLAKLVSEKPVRCLGAGQDVYGRMLANCKAGDLDIGVTMIEGGMAVALPEAPYKYTETANRAQKFKIGIWGSSFMMPAEWRTANPQVVRRQPKETPPSRALQSGPERVYRNNFGCAIKGNRSRRGEWIYHLPGKPYYDQTRPEDLFCTESEARAAGYRRSKAG